MSEEFLRYNNGAIVSLPKMQSLPHVLFEVKIVRNYVR